MRGADVPCWLLSAFVVIRRIDCCCASSLVVVSLRLRHGVFALVCLLVSYLQLRCAALQSRCGRRVCRSALAAAVASLSV